MYLVVAVTLVLLQAVVTQAQPSPICESHVCPTGQLCFPDEVQCYPPPCPRQPKCFPDPCDSHRCPIGEQCFLNQVQCIKAPCPALPQCYPYYVCPKPPDVTTCQVTHDSCLNDSQCNVTGEKCCLYGCGKRCKKLVLDNPCSYGRPIRGSNNKTIACNAPRGCPADTSCTNFPSGRPPVCCPHPPFGNPCRARGQPSTDINTGVRLFCGRGPNSVKCPIGTTCVIDPDDSFAVCCPNPCSMAGGSFTGGPVTDSSGKELFCGRGPNRVSCPYGSQCNVHPTDAWAVCCPVPNPCGNLGKPVVDSAGIALYCGRGSRHVNCPKGTSCLTDPLDRFAVCCPLPNPCGDRGQPVIDYAGRQLFCGRGPGRVDCPVGSTCIIDPVDRFAVCCPQREENCGTKRCAPTKYGVQGWRRSWGELCYMDYYKRKCSNPPCPVCYIHPCQTMCPDDPWCFLVDNGCAGTCEAAAFCPTGRPSEAGSISASLVVMVVMMLTSTCTTIF